MLKRWFTGPHVIKHLDDGAIVLNDPVIVQLLALNASRCHQSKFVPSAGKNVIIVHVIKVNRHSLFFFIRSVVCEFLENVSARVGGDVQVESESSSVRARAGERMLFARVLVHVFQGNYCV
jgi:hypothetical protein